MGLNAPKLHVASTCASRRNGRDAVLLRLSVYGVFGNPCFACRSVSIYLDLAAFVDVEVPSRMMSSRMNSRLSYDNQSQKTAKDEITSVTSVISVTFILFIGVLGVTDCVTDVTDKRPKVDFTCVFRIFSLPKFGFLPFYY